MTWKWRLLFSRVRKLLLANVLQLHRPLRAYLTQATKQGIIEVLLEAGAGLLPPGCGACAGYGVGVLAEDEVCLLQLPGIFKVEWGRVLLKCI